jgi:hypothetical protein
MNKLPRWLVQMARRRTPYALSEEDIAVHPAVNAYRRLRGNGVIPEAVHVLKDPRGYADHTGVYRLHLDRGREVVIAKRCVGEGAAQLEYKVYETILPALSLARLHAYGTVADPEVRSSWLFLEEATGAAFSNCNPTHGELGAEYLAALHTRSEQLAAIEELPDRGPDYYRGLISEIQSSLGEKSANPALTADDVSVLDRILSQLEGLHTRWGDLESACSLAPQTLVHGDFVGKNVRVETRAGRMVLLAFDWEQAGRAIPAIDILKIDLDSYWRFVEPIWTQMSYADLALMSNVGSVFRSIAATSWAVQSLHTPWVDDAMDKLRVYESRLIRVLETAPWAS